MTVTAINEFDLAFVVDTTASMGGLIAAAQRQMVDTIDELSQSADVAMRLGVVEYRDHPPQDRLIHRVYSFTENLEKARKTINKLNVDGGGDEPEAVFAGLVAATRKLDWRVHARRIAVLVGDAPPHGQGLRGDHWPQACPSGETIHSTAATLEAAGIRLFAIGLTNRVTKSFTDLARLTGGSYFDSQQGSGAISRLKEILVSEFGELEFDRAVYDKWARNELNEYADVADDLHVSESRVVASVTRLSARGLLKL